MTNEDKMPAFKVGDRMMGEARNGKTFTGLLSLDRVLACGDETLLNYEDGVGGVFVLTASLRPAPPAPTDDGEPKVGEVWHSLVFGSAWGELTIVEDLGGKFRCTAGGGTHCSAGEVGVFHRTDLEHRISPAPSPSVPEPAPKAELGPPPVIDWNKICARCGCARDDHDPRCSYHKKPEVKRDPYREHERTLRHVKGEHYALWCREQKELRAAKLEQTKAGLDRPLPARGKWDWDVADAPELFST